jgi:Mrp family chromosome partitioning ATPase
MKVVLASLTEKYDYLILDSSPVLPVTDAIILSTQVDGVILLVNTKKTRQNELKQVIKRLREVDSNLLGVVMNRIHQTRKSYNLYYKPQMDYQEESEIEASSQPASVQLDKSNGFLGKKRQKEQT